MLGLQLEQTATENSVVTYSHLLSKCNVGCRAVNLIDVVKSIGLHSMYITVNNTHQTVLEYFLFLHSCNCNEHS